MEDTRPTWARIIAKILVVPQRVFICIMAFFAIVNAYTMRICLSVTITQIVLPRNYTADDIKEEVVCPIEPSDNATSSSSHISSGTQDWSQELQGYILSSFYIGYIITHIPGGLLSERYGAKYVLCLGILSTAIFTIFTPLIIDTTGAIGLIVLRVLMGLGEGTTFPGLNSLLAQWVPVNERGILGAFVLGGGQFGTIIGNTISGMILYNYSWPIVFYVFAILAILWFIFFVCLCSSDPKSHPYISPKELNYLMEEMGHVERRKDLPPTPWKSIFTSPPVLSLVLSQIGHDWGFYLMVTDLPKYMNDVMQFSIKKNGIYSSLPFLLMWITSLLSGYITDVIIKRKITSITLARNINTTIAAVGPGLFMVLASYSGCHRVIVVIFFTICMGLMGAYYAGMKLTALDLSPNYAGTVMAITNGIGAATGFIVPVVVGAMTPNTTLFEWRLVFWLGFCVLTVTVIPYNIWNSGEIQKWNEG